jgi:hypothetical protein
MAGLFQNDIQAFIRAPYDERLYLFIKRCNHFKELGAPGAVADHRDVFYYQLLPNGAAVMKKSLFASILMVLLEGFSASSVMADDTLAKFQGAIGDIPVANVAGVANPMAPSLT